MKTIATIWECWTYDVWGNARDGYEVNDRYCFDRHLSLELEVKTFNAGTPQQFLSAQPTDRQIKKVFGVKCQIETDGDDTHICVTRVKDGYPIGEMFCLSHASLSPIKEAQA